jgi:hypothetical protein
MMALPSTRIRCLLLVTACWAITACGLTGPSSGQLAAYYQSPEGSAEWKKDEERFADTAKATANEFHRAKTIETLTAYEKGRA